MHQFCSYITIYIIYLIPEVAVCALDKRFEGGRWLLVVLQFKVDLKRTSTTKRLCKLGPGMVLIFYMSLAPTPIYL